MVVATEVKVLAPDVAAKIQELTHPCQMQADEWKRQKQALRRRMEKPDGLKTGLLEKYNACKRNKFALCPPE